MRMFFYSDAPLDGLSRVLDCVRRLDVDVRHLSAGGGSDNVLDVVIELDIADQQVREVLFNRIAQIDCILGLRVELEAAVDTDRRLAPHACHA